MTIKSHVYHFCCYYFGLCTAGCPYSLSYGARYRIVCIYSAQAQGTILNGCANWSARQSCTNAYQTVDASGF